MTTLHNDTGSGAMPAIAGIGLKASHYEALLATPAPVGFLEFHAENYMGEGGPPLRYLDALAAQYPLSIHGVGMSLAGPGPMSRAHLARWRALVRRCRPVLVSEHLAWSALDGRSLNDLLPAPLTAFRLDRTAEHVDEMQQAIGRQIAIENISAYIQFEDDELREPEFLMALVERTGCGLLLDVNNLYVNARNHDFDARSWLREIDGEAILEYHLAGHSEVALDDRSMLVDDHGSTVCDDVWALYRHAVVSFGHRPTLIEWDTRVPGLRTLLREAARANDVAACAWEAP